MKKTATTRDLARSGLLLALLCASAPLSIPMPFGVPLTLQSALVMVTAMTSTMRNGLLVVGAYLFLGAIGLPVFANATGGLVRFAGPTGGYLLGFLLAVVVIRATLPLHDPTTLRQVLACAAGGASIFALGMIWLILGHGMSLTAAFQSGCLPFLPLSALKIAFAVALRRALPPDLREPGR